jgi:ADP-ribose pyrophosphatase
MDDHDGLREEKITSERVYDGTILDLDVDTVRLPNGSDSVREIVRHRGAVVVFPMHRDRSVVLVNQFRYATGEVLLEFPAGKLDPGESPRECAARELEEETGWSAGALHALGSFYTTPGFSDEELHVFVATHLEPAEDCVADPDEAIEIVTLTLDELLAAARDGGIKDGKTLTTLAMARLQGWIRFRRGSPAYSSSTGQ